MGSLTYPVRGSHAVSIDDRTLAHLQVVIGSKLRLRQSFFFNWIDDLGSGGGRTSVWIDSTIQLTFTYDDNQRYSVNRAWLDVLMETANSPQGLQLLSEPLAIAA